MNVSIETLTGLERRLTIAIDSDTFEQQITSRLQADVEPPVQRCERANAYQRLRTSEQVRVLGRKLGLARPAGLEPATLGLEGRCSIQLSYGRLNRIKRKWSG